jgi:hypothetical protein
VKADWVARALAIGSLLIGFFGLWIAYLNHRRDRPRLRRTFDYGRTRDTAHVFQIFVSNVGYRPLSVMRVQLATLPAGRADRRLRRILFLSRHARIRRWLAPIIYGEFPPPTGISVEASGEFPLLLEPGTTAEFRLAPDELRSFGRPGGLGAIDRRLWASVLDVLGNETSNLLSVNEHDAVLRLSQASEDRT